MRLFIAINFSESTLKALLAARERLRELTGGAGSFTHGGSLHLTLAFLGEVERERAPLAVEAMEAAQGRPMTLIFDRAGHFKREGGDIWWAGGPENPALAAYRKRLVRELRARGFVLEARRFTPHVTLARRVTAELPLDVRLLPEPVSEHVSSAGLVLSELGRGAPRYTELDRVRFSG